MYLLCHFSFLTQCRPLSVSMGNAIKYLKYHITQTPQEMSDAEVSIVEFYYNVVMIFFPDNS